MINKLRSNYQLSNLLARIFFVLAYVLYSWQNSLAAAIALQRDLAISGNATIYLAILTSLLLGVLIMFLVPLFANWFLNLSHFYNIPRAEYCLLTTLFLAMFFFAGGLLKLVNLVTPILLTWGAILIPFVLSIGFAIWFYKVTAKLYFNDVTAVYYFRNFAILYFVVVVVFVVVL